MIMVKLQISMRENLLLKMSDAKKIGIVLVRSLVGVSPDVRETCKSLVILIKNSVVIRDDSPVLRGMLQKIKDFVTWGELDEDTFKALIAKSDKKFIRLSPPRKGYGKNGIKVPFKMGGALGDRKEKINDLLTRMI